MKVTVEMTESEEIRAFFAKIVQKTAENVQKPNITVYAQPIPEQLPEGFKPAPEEVPFKDETPAPAPTPAPALNAPEPAVKQISYDEVAQAAIAKVHEQKQEPLRALLQKYGAQALPDLKDKPDQLAAFYKDLEVI